jgi:predicted nucleotidyltransferase
MDARALIGRLPSVVAPQAAALLRLLDAAEADPRVRALDVRGSVARGAADEHSDLDTRVWIAEADFDAAVADLPALARAVGPTLDILFERPGSRYLFVHYDDGVQLELLARHVSEAKGRQPREVVLLDRDGLSGTRSSRRRRGSWTSGRHGRGWRCTTWTSTCAVGRRGKR